MAKIWTSVLAAVAIAAVAAPHASAVTLGDAKLSETTGVGVHNTYSKDAYTYLVQGLDNGASLIEVDAWANSANGKWDVSHDKPLASVNNCVQVADGGNPETGDRNQNLDSCLDDIRVWLNAHPTNNPIVVKLELKDGFGGSGDLTASGLDSYINAHLGSKLFTPANLLGGYPTLDAASKANNWPSRNSLAGKAIVEIIPGTVEAKLSSTLSNEVYAKHLRDLYAAGNISQAKAFPAILGKYTADPRTAYDSSIQPWFVFFDGDASTYNGLDMSWYGASHYFVVMTDAQSVAPAISDTTPTDAEAIARVSLLAKKNASIVSSDWRTSTNVLPTIVARG
jgi:hypothetical protein